MWSSRRARLGTGVCCLWCSAQAGARAHCTVKLTRINRPTDPTKRRRINRPTELPTELPHTQKIRQCSDGRTDRRKLLHNLFLGLDCDVFCELAFVHRGAGSTSSSARTSTCTRLLRPTCGCTSASNADGAPRPRPGPRMVLARLMPACRRLARCPAHPAPAPCPAHSDHACMHLGRTSGHAQGSTSLALSLSRVTARRTPLRIARPPSLSAGRPAVAARL